MPSNRHDDRAWTEAVDRYVATAKRERRPRTNPGRYVLASAAVLALVVSPFAIGATGSALKEGKRNPSSGSSTRETEIISKSKTYGTRQSNVGNGNGGGAIYGCRSNSGREPCIRSNNLENGRAFEFETDGDEAGRIVTKTDAGKPFTTNATGRRDGSERGSGGRPARREDRLPRADQHGLDQAARSGRPGPECQLRGRVRTWTCAPRRPLRTRSLHASWNKDPGNVPFYRQDNDLNPGESFSLLAQNDDSSQGTLVYTSPDGRDHVRHLPR